MAGVLMLVLGLWRAAPAQTAYTSYETFEAWRSLVPELRQPRVRNLTVAGHELWAHGQLRLAAEMFLHGDLRRTGGDDWAVPLADGDDAAPCAYVLVTTRGPDGWQRVFLQPVALEDRSSGFNLVWNQLERAIGIDHGQRKRVTSPATLVWEHGRVIEAKAGYVLDLVLVTEIIEWVADRGRFEYRRAVPPEEWDADRP